MTSEERLRSNTLFILQSSFGANSEGRTQMSCYYSLTNTSELPTFTLKMCPFKFKNKIFSLPAVETQKKVTEFRSPWMFLFQMRFSIANHFECLPDHLDSSSVGQHTCVCATEQLSGEITSQAKSGIDIQQADEKQKTYNSSSRITFEVSSL